MNPNPEINPRTPRFQVSVDVKTIAERLKNTAVGDVVTYDDLSKLIGRDVRNGARHVLNGARRYLLVRDRHMIFGIVTSLGVKRLNQKEIVDTGEYATSRIRKMARRSAILIGEGVDRNSLDEPTRVKYDRHTALLGGALGSLLHHKSIAKLDKKILEAQKALPLAQTIKALCE